VNRLALVTAGGPGRRSCPTRRGSRGCRRRPAFSPGAGVAFGFNIEGEYSDDAMNKNRTGGGHHVRFWPARDHFGKLLANT
jgi:hypothetical protein